MDESMSASQLSMSPWHKSAYQTQRIATDVVELQWKNSQTKCAPLDALMAEAKKPRKRPPSETDFRFLTESTPASSSTSTTPITSHASGSRPRPRPSKEGNFERTPSGSLSSLFGEPSVFIGTLKTVTHRVDENTRTRQEQMARMRHKEKKDLAQSGGIQRRRRRVNGDTGSTGDISIRVGRIETEATVSRQRSLPELARPPEVTDSDISMGIEVNTTPFGGLDSLVSVQRHASPDTGKLFVTADNSTSKVTRQKQSQTPPASPSYPRRQYQPRSIFTANPSPISSRDTTPVPPCRPSAAACRDRLPKASSLDPDHLTKPSTTPVPSAMRNSAHSSRTSASPSIPAYIPSTQASQHPPRSSQRPPILGMQRRSHHTKPITAGPSLSQGNHKIPAFKPPQMRARTTTAVKPGPARQVPTPEPSPVQQTDTHAAKASSPLPPPVDADSSYGDISFDMDELEMALQKYD
ncbi:hypothetical protein OF83DRAFT_1168015 [Amylostereum chailletii]|nr:hypothetical protein OF83DRAFT_1168015 [Amylostereum chailletii]